MVRISVCLSVCLIIFSCATNAISARLNFDTEPAASTDEGHGHDEAATDEKGQGESNSLVGNIVTLGLLILLQAVLGFDNLLYISLESKNAPEDKRQAVRAWGIGLAIGLRIVLLFALYFSLDSFEAISVLEFKWSFAEAHFNLHSIIVLAGGAFIIYTAMKEIWHMTRLEHDDHGHGSDQRKTAGWAIFWIMVMNVVFSFDSILSAMALTKVLWVMTAAIILSGLAMIWLADHVSEFLTRNRMYEVLGLFVLFVVGIMLVSEGGHLAHLNLFGNPVEPMTKTTFYFVLAVLVLTDIVQSRYQKKLLAEAKHEPGHSHA